MVSGKKSENQLQRGNTFFSNSLSYMPYNAINNSWRLLIQKAVPGLHTMRHKELKRNNKGLTRRIIEESEDIGYLVLEYPGHSFCVFSELQR